MASPEKSETPAQEEEEKIPLSRREVINLAWLASLGFFLLPFGGVTLLFAYPRFREGEFGGKFRVSASDFPAPDEAPAENAKGKFWLSRTEEGVRAIYKVCTHLGCLYNWQEQDNKFICPCHGSQFEKSSVFIQGPAPRSLDLFRLTAFRGEEVLAQTQDSNEAIEFFDDPGVVYEVDTGDRIVGKPHA